MVAPEEPAVLHRAPLAELAELPALAALAALVSEQVLRLLIRELSKILHIPLLILRLLAELPVLAATAARAALLETFQGAPELLEAQAATAARVELSTSVV